MQRTKLNDDVDDYTDYVGFYSDIGNEEVDQPRDASVGVVARNAIGRDILPLPMKISTAYCLPVKWLGAHALISTGYSPHHALELFDYFLNAVDTKAKEAPSLITQSMQSGINRVLVSNLFDHMGHFWFRLNPVKNLALTWSCRIAGFKIKAPSEFSSQLAKVVSDRIGSNLVDFHLATLMIQGRRYTIVANTSYLPTFQTLNKSLTSYICELNLGNPKALQAVLFVHSVARELTEESDRFSAEALNCCKTQFLYGLEDQAALMLTNLASNTANLGNGESPDQPMREFLLATTRRSLYREIWQSITRETRIPVDRKVINDFTRIRKILLQNPNAAFPKSASLYNSKECAKLFKFAALTLLKQYPFSERIRTVAKDHMANPSVNLTYQEYMQEMVAMRATRAAAVLRNTLREISSSIPSDAEIVISADNLLIEGIVKGLFRSN